MQTHINFYRQKRLLGSEESAERVRRFQRPAEIEQDFQAATHGFEGVYLSQEGENQEAPFQESHERGGYESVE